MERIACNWFKHRTLKHKIWKRIALLAIFTILTGPALPNNLKLNSPKLSSLSSAVHRRPEKARCFTARGLPDSINSSLYFTLTPLLTCAVSWLPPP